MGRQIESDEVLNCKIIDGTLLLEPGTTIIGSLCLDGIHGLVVLSDDLTVTGDLSLRGTSIAALPCNLTVMGSIDLEGCAALGAISKGLKVFGSLDVELCESLSAIPSDARIQGNLYAYGSGINASPVRGCIDGEVFGIQ